MIYERVRGGRGDLGACWLLPLSACRSHVSLAKFPSVALCRSTTCMLRIVAASWYAATGVVRRIVRAESTGSRRAARSLIANVCWIMHAAGPM